MLFHLKCVRDVANSLEKVGDVAKGLQNVSTIADSFQEASDVPHLREEVGGVGEGLEEVDHHGLDGGVVARHPVPLHPLPLLVLGHGHGADTGQGGRAAEAPGVGDLYGELEDVLPHLDGLGPGDLAHLGGEGEQLAGLHGALALHRLAQLLEAIVHQDPLLGRQAAWAHRGAGGKQTRESTQDMRQGHDMDKACTVTQTIWNSCSNSEAPDIQDVLREACSNCSTWDS